MYVLRTSYVVVLCEREQRMFAKWLHIYCKLILQALHPDEDDSAEDDEVADEDEEEPGMFDDAEEETNGAGEAGDGPEQMDAD